MDISPAITIKKEEPAEILFPSEDNSKLPELYMLALHNLYELLPEQRKATLTTGDSLIMEAANYALILEKSLQENEDISAEKISEETFPLSPKEEIKRPRNGFIRYAMEHRKEMASLFPYMENRKISRLLGSKWRKLSEKERKPYEDEFKEDMKVLQEKYPNWMYSSSKKNPTDTDLNALLLPSRLRPRNKIKRKVHTDCFEEIDLKSSGYRKKRRKKTAVTSKVKPNDLDDDDSQDLMNKSFVETIFMPQTGAADTGNEYSTELDKKFDLNMNKSFVDTFLMPPTVTADTGNEYYTKLDKKFNQNMNNDFLTFDLENEISKLKLDYSNHLWLKWLDDLDAPVPDNDLLTLESKNDLTNIKTELV